MIKKGKLYIIATPIGNLGDVTYRAIETLKKVDLILCEDTRITKRLLDRYEIKKPTLSYHQRSKLSKTDKIIELLKEGKELALVTDAGTPGISDPGNELIGNILEHFDLAERTPEISQVIEIIPIPGPSAMTALVSVAGIDMSKFVFLGFPPHKKGRETFFRKVLEACFPVVFYESPHRVSKNIALLKELAGESGREMKLIVGRELTKMFEEIIRGSVSEIAEHFEKEGDKVRGEIVIIAYPKN